MVTDAVSGGIGTDLLGRAFLCATMADVPKIARVCKGWKLVLEDTGDALWRDLAKKDEPQLVELMERNKTDVQWKDILRSRRTLDAPNQNPVPPLNEKIDEKFMFELKLNIGDESFTLHHLDEDAGIAIKCGINFGSRDQNDVDRIKEAIFRKSQDVTAYEHQRRGLVEPGQKY